MGPAMQTTKDICKPRKDSQPVKVNRERQWLSGAYLRPSGIDRPERLDEMTEFENIIFEHPSDVMLPKYDHTPEEMSMLCGEGMHGWLLSSHLEWLAKKVNCMQNNCLNVIINHTAPADFAKLAESMPDLERVNFIMNVGKDFNGNVFISSMHQSGTHWVLVSLDLTSCPTVLYCDSLGWKSPTNLLKFLSNYTSIFGIATFEHLVMMHVPSETGNSHQCTMECKNYPLQTCTNVCGLVAVVCAAIFSLDEELFKVIVGRKSNLPLFVHDPTRYEKYLRRILIHWFIKEIDLSFLSHCKTSQPSKKNSHLLDHTYSKIVNNCKRKAPFSEQTMEIKMKKKEQTCVENTHLPYFYKAELIAPQTFVDVKKKKELLGTIRSTPKPFYDLKRQKKYFQPIATNPFCDLKTTQNKPFQPIAPKPFCDLKTQNKNVQPIAPKPFCDLKITQNKNFSPIAPKPFCDLKKTQNKHFQPIAPKAFCDLKTTQKKIFLPIAPKPFCNLKMTYKKNLEITEKYTTATAPPSLGDLKTPTIKKNLQITEKYTAATAPPSLGDLKTPTIIQITEKYTAATAPPSLGDLKTPTIKKNLQITEKYTAATAPPSLGDLKTPTIKKNLQITEKYTAATAPPSLGDLKTPTIKKNLQITEKYTAATAPPSLGDLKTPTIKKNLQITEKYTAATAPPSLGDLKTPTIKKNLQITEKYTAATAPPSLGDLKTPTIIQITEKYTAATAPPSLGDLKTPTIKKNLQITEKYTAATAPPSLGDLKTPTIIQITEKYTAATAPPSLGDLKTPTIKKNLQITEKYTAATAPPSLGDLKTPTIKKNLQNSKRYRCTICKINLSCQQSWFKHNKRKHNNIMIKDMRQHHCQCSLCPHSFPTIQKLIKHYNENHMKNFQICKKTFPNEEEFKQWKKEVEKLHSSNFFLTRGKKTIGNKLVSYFYCSRSGYSQPQFKCTGNPKRAPKSQGTKKLGKLCVI